MQLKKPTMHKLVKAALITQSKINLVRKKVAAAVQKRSSRIKKRFLKMSLLTKKLNLIF